MRRVLVLVTRPSHLTPAEADAWLRGAFASVRASSLVDVVRLTPLRAASERHSQPWDLLVELHLSDGVDAADLVDDRLCVELLLDLRLLGLRPVVLAADGPGELA